MVVERPPTEITEEGWYWLRAKDVTGFPRIARDTYFPTHDVIRPAETTEADSPDSENEALRRIDRQALDESYLSGKWIIEQSPNRTDALWNDIIDDVSAEYFWDAKVTTVFGREAFEEELHAILVYTPNYFDKADVVRVRERLRDTHGITEEIYYKPDIFTLLGIYEETLDETGVSDAARFVE
uniref:putative phosphothreonine lyase domain-containing protein n=1 Tax=Haloprofundus sp. MHR1 TaxID=2572921 RepID=UPI001F3D8B3E|nr:putative phosphothreonine lyase domain-containg protein [Haloprofundus sp. MHR1]